MMELDALPPREIENGGYVFIPPLLPQCVINIGEDDLIFLAICTPRFLPENYEDLEEI
ncbi:MAG: hypothetical protein N2572_04445 [Syntrophales bacterium]|nr:hypothetical protein [Syntrophales bacterium]